MIRRPPRSTLFPTRRSSDRAEPWRAIGFRKRYGIPAERAIVAQVSWIIPEKGIADFLESARLVLAQNRNVQFVLRSEEHTSELQSQSNLVCRLLLEKTNRPT